MARHKKIDRRPRGMLINCLFHLEGEGRVCVCGGSSLDWIGLEVTKDAAHYVHIEGLTEEMALQLAKDLVSGVEENRELRKSKAASKSRAAEAQTAGLPPRTDRPPVQPLVRSGRGSCGQPRSS